MRFASGLLLIFTLAALFWLWSRTPNDRQWTGESQATSQSLEAIQAVDSQADSSAATQAGNESTTPPAGQMGGIPGPEDGRPRFFEFDKLALVWDRMSPFMRQTLKPTSSESNIRPADYAGPESCEQCHRENYRAWSDHPHRWMNALASESTILGDFSGDVEISYLGGIARFYRDGDEFRMRFDRDDLQREYLVKQTIGSRFYQYYVGVGLVGPEPKDHEYYSTDFVLPFGYWLHRKAWVPVVHIFEEAEEGSRWEPVETLKPPIASSDAGDVGTARGILDPDQDLGVVYARACNHCHTTFALGDMMIRNPKRIGPSLPEPAVLEMNEYVASVHPEMWDGLQAPQQFSSDDLRGLIDDYVGFEAPQHAVTLGVSCEACHLGCQQHAEDEKSLPAFVGQSPNLHLLRRSTLKTGRNQANINAICARCHSGNRPTFAAGMSTWNSTEHSDAMRGSCYSELSCVQCHDPHQATGLKWAKSPEQDDASCLNCHQKFDVAETRFEHTRHPAGSAGDRCMNCHMPKINEGMQDVVRTHTIFSPTQPDMIEANHPNACNLCHLEKGIDWTIDKLESWYAADFDQQKVEQAYPDRGQAVGRGWLNQEHQATRLVAMEAFARQQAQWGLPELVELLDDPYLLNRQFAQTAVESLSGIQLDERFGYWYYMTASEREDVLPAIRDALIDE